jgi:hypothetical protein
MMDMQPWFENANYRELPQYTEAPQDYRRLVDTYRDRGIVVLEEMGLDAVAIDRAVRALDGRYPAQGAGGGRIQDAWQFSSDVRSIATSETILRTLRFLYGREPIPFQTLNFALPTQQRTHSDTIHFNTMPYGFMCGVWVALEDVDADNGPLFYYPGSQNLPVYHMHDLGLHPGAEFYPQYEEKIDSILKASPYRLDYAHIKKGQAVIWSHNIFHGGSKWIDRSRTRLSQVTHYYFPGCIYYTPLLSDPLNGRWQLRQIADIRTGKRVPVFPGLQASAPPQPAARPQSASIRFRYSVDAK